MKKFILVIFLTIIYFFNLNAQDIGKEEWRNMTKQERKEYRQLVAAQEQQFTMHLLASKQWVLEAHQLQDRYGQMYNIISSLNFVGVDKNFGAVQLGSNDGIGENGVGGITLEGNVRKYEIKEGKKPGSGATIRIEILGSSSGHISMSIRVSANGNASATVSDNFGNRLTYIGRVVSINESSVFKGQTSY